MFASLKELLENSVLNRQESVAPATAGRLETAAAALMLEIGLADSTLDAAELAAIQNALVDAFRLEAEQAEELIALARREVDLAVSLHEFTRLLNEQLTRQEKIRIIELLWRVAFANAELDKYEEHYIRKIADLLYIPHRDYLKAKHAVADRGEASVGATGAISEPAP